MRAAAIPCQGMDSAAHEENPRILIVDDEKVIRDILTDFLTLEGYLVRGERRRSPRGS